MHGLPKTKIINVKKVMAHDVLIYEPIYQYQRLDCAAIAKSFLPTRIYVRHIM